MTRRLVSPCGVAAFARVLTIWRLLRASLHTALCLPTRCLRHRPFEVAGARGKSHRFQRCTNSRRVFFARRWDVRRGTKGNSKPKPQKPFASSLRRGFLWLFILGVFHLSFILLLTEQLLMGSYYTRHVFRVLSVNSGFRISPCRVGFNPISNRHGSEFRIARLKRMTDSHKPTELTPSPGRRQIGDYACLGYSGHSQERRQ